MKIFELLGSNLSYRLRLLWLRAMAGCPRQMIFFCSWGLSA